MPAVNVDVLRRTWDAPHQLGCQTVKAHLAQLPTFQRNRNLSVQISLAAHEVRWGRIHDGFEVERRTRTSGVDHRREFVAHDNVHAETLRLQDIMIERLGIVCPRVGVEVEQHMIACADVFLNV